MRDAPQRCAGQRAGGFVVLLVAAGVSWLGDGIYAVGLPLLAAHLTQSAVAVSVVASAVYWPWIVLGLPSGALVDRWERVAAMRIVDATRAAVVLGGVALLMLGWMSIPALVVIGILLGAGQTIFDPASQATVPTIVPRDPSSLHTANTRLLMARTLNLELVGPALGGLLFAISATVPFALNALSFAVSAVLLSRVPRRETVRTTRLSGLRADVLDGIRFIARSTTLRTLAFGSAVGNVAYVAGAAVLVLFAERRLGLGSHGYGILIAVAGLGGLVGGLLARPASRRLQPMVLIVGLFAVEAACELGIAMTRSPAVACSLLAAMSCAMMVANVSIQTVRHLLVPDEILGRVVSAFRLLTMGSRPLGALVGGVIAAHMGLRAPYVFAAVGLGLVGLVTAYGMGTATAAEIANQTGS